MTDHYEPSATWVNPLVLEAERAHEREADIRERCQHLVFAADQALADLAFAQAQLTKDGDLAVFRAIQRACERLRRGLDALHGGAV